MKPCPYKLLAAISFPVNSILKLPMIGFGATKSTLFMTIGSDKVFVTFTHITDATFFIGMVGNSEAGTLFTKPTTGNPSLPTAR